MKIKKLYIIAMGASFLLASCHSGNGNSNNTPEPSQNISLYDPVGEVSKVVVTDESGVALYTGGVVAHPNSSKIEIKLPLNLHDRIEYVKLYNSKNILISVGQVGDFIAKVNGHLEMDNDLTALGSYLVLAAIEKNFNNSIINPVETAGVLISNYKAVIDSDPYTLLGAKFVLLQQSGKTEEAAKQEILTMLGNYAEKATPLAVDNKVLELVNLQDNGWNTSRTTQRMLQAGTSAKSISFDDTLDARNSCYDTEGVFTGKTALSACVMEKLNKLNKYSDSEYTNAKQSVASSSGSIGAKASALLVTQLAKTETMEGLGKASAALGLQCTLSADSVKSSSKWLGYLNTAMSFAPIPFSTLGSMAKGYFDGVCPGVQDDPTLNLMTQSFTDIKDRLIAIDKKIDDLRIAQEANFNKIATLLTDYRTWDKEQILRKDIDSIQDLYDTMRDNQRAADGTRAPLDSPVDIYDVLSKQVNSKKGNTFDVFALNYNDLFKLISKVKSNHHDLDTYLASCDAKALNDATSKGLGLERQLDFCSDAYNQYASQLEYLTMQTYEIGSSIFKVQSDIYETIQNMDEMKRKAAAKGETFVSPYDFDPAAYRLITDKQTLPVNQDGLDGLLEREAKNIAHSYAKADALNDAKYFLSSRSYLYKTKLSGPERDVLDSIAKISTCSITDEIHTSKDAKPTTQLRANVVEYYPKTNDVVVSCGGALATYNLNASQPVKLFAGALLPKDSNVADNVNTHLPANNSATGWETFTRDGSDGYYSRTAYFNNNVRQERCGIVADSEYSDRPVSSATPKVNRGYQYDRFAQLGFWIESNIHSYALGYDQECILDGTCNVVNTTMKDMDAILLKQSPYLSPAFKYSNGTSVNKVITSTWASDDGPYPFSGINTNDYSYGILQWTNNDIIGDTIKRAPYATGPYVFDAEKNSGYPNGSYDNSLNEFTWLGYFTSLTTSTLQKSQDPSISYRDYRPFLAYVKAPILCSWNQVAYQTLMRTTQRKEVTMVGTAPNGVIHPFAMQYEIAYTFGSDTPYGSIIGKIEHSARLLCLTTDCKDGNYNTPNNTKAGEKDQSLMFSDGSIVSLRAYRTSDAKFNLNGKSVKNFGILHGFIVEMK